VYEQGGGRLDIGPAGLYSGAVVATPATGPAVRTPLGHYKEPERYDLTIKAIGRDGQPAALADAGVLNVDDGELFADFLVFDEDATLAIRVAPGHYHIMGFVVGEDFGSVSMVGDPEVRVTGATTFTLDARRAEPVTFGIQGVATDPTMADVGWTRLDAAATYGLASSFSVGPARRSARPPPPRPCTTCSTTAARSPTRPGTSCPPPSGPGWPGSTATTAPSTTTPSTATCGSASRPSSSSPAGPMSRSPCPGPGPSS
jgi:hypothetical protein